MSALLHTPHSLAPAIVILDSRYERDGNGDDDAHVHVRVVPASPGAVVVHVKLVRMVQHVVVVGSEFVISKDIISVNVNYLDTIT